MLVPPSAQRHQKYLIEAGAPRAHSASATALPCRALGFDAPDTRPSCALRSAANRAPALTGDATFGGDIVADADVGPGGV